MKKYVKPLNNKTMVLNLLNSREKELFLYLAVALIKSDGVIHESEKVVLQLYAKEMEISIPSNLYEKQDLAIKEWIAELSNLSDIKTKRAIFVELSALAFADGNYSIEEKEIIQMLAESFNFDDKTIEYIIGLQDSYMISYYSLLNFIEKGE